MLSNWGFYASTAEDFTIVIDTLTDVVLPGNTFSVYSLLLPFLLMQSFFCLLAYSSLRNSWVVDPKMRDGPNSGEGQVHDTTKNNCGRRLNAKADRKSVV